MISNKRPVSGTILLIILSSTFVLYALSTGITGRTLKNGIGCTCHNSEPSGNVSVIIDGPSIINANETANYTVTITGGPLVAAGTNIAALNGVLNVGAGLQKIGNELTHIGPKTAAGGSVVFQFTYTAPSTQGTDTIYANGNSVNLNGQNTGDSWNFASNKIVTVQSPTDVDDDNILTAFKLEQNYPNPFNPSTKINYSLAQSSNVKVVVYSISGEEVATLVNEYKNAGAYSIDFNASNLTSGIYFYKMITNDFIETKKMLMIK